MKFKVWRAVVLFVPIARSFAHSRHGKRTATSPKWDPFSAPPLVSDTVLYGMPVEQAKNSNLVGSTI